MNINPARKFLFLLICLVLICFISCQDKYIENEDCFKFINEIYEKDITDTILIKEAFDSHNNLLEKFEESSIKGLNYEAYNFQFYSSHGYGKLVKFENKNNTFSITVKCETKNDWLPECKEYKIKIEEEEWNELEKMIYEFDFWTTENFRANKNVLDGYVYFLEGNRPKAQKCNKKKYRLVGRGSPSYDKIGALCESILGYEDQLKFKYEQFNKIK